MIRFLKISLAAFFMVTIIGLAGFSQEGLPYEKTSKNEWVFKERSYDEVWSATVRSLMQLKYQVASSDKEGGIISAQKAKGVLNRKVAQEQLENFQVLIEKAESDIKVSCQFTMKAGSMFQSDQSKYLLAKIAENLYGKPEKKKNTD